MSKATSISSSGSKFWPSLPQRVYPARLAGQVKQNSFGSSILPSHAFFNPSSRPRTSTSERRRYGQERSASAMGTRLAEATDVGRSNDSEDTISSDLEPKTSLHDLRQASLERQPGSPPAHGPDEHGPAEVHRPTGSRGERRTNAQFYRLRQKDLGQALEQGRVTSTDAEHPGGPNHIFLPSPAIPWLMTARGGKPVAAILAVVVVTVIPGLWFGFIAPYYWLHVPHQESNGSGGIAVVVLFLWLMMICWSSMVMAAFSDPGILPRGIDPSPVRVTLEADGDEPEEVVVRPREVRVGASRPLAGNGGTRQQGGVAVIRTKWCETCRIYRPPRASHCRVCGCCIENLDHHCSYLNTCIGRRNYRPFLVFLTSGTVLLVWILVTSAVQLKLASDRLGAASYSTAFGHALARYPVSGILFILSLVILFPISGLLGFHYLLVSRNQTTHERLKSAAVIAWDSEPAAEKTTTASRKYPYSLGSCWNNCLYVWTRPTTHAWIERNKRVAWSQDTA